MPLTSLDGYFECLPEPTRSCAVALRRIIIGFDPDVSEVMRYSLPFYLYRGRRFCYIWNDKKTKQPYIGFTDGIRMNHPALAVDKRKRMAIYTVHPEKDIPLETVTELLALSISFLPEPEVRARRKRKVIV